MSYDNDDEMDEVDKISLKVVLTVIFALTVGITIVSGINIGLHNWYDYQVQMSTIETAGKAIDSITDIFKGQ